MVRWKLLALKKGFKNRHHKKDSMKRKVINSIPTKRIFTVLRGWGEENRSDATEMRPLIGYSGPGHHGEIQE